MADVPAHGLGFASDTWIDATRAQTLHASEDSSLAEIKSDSQMLATVVALTTPHEGLVRVLDFGGGMGIGYLRLRHALDSKRTLEYHIVEGERICEEGQKLLHAHPSVRFLSKMPDTVDNVDVVYSCSSLQYIDDYRSLLASFAKLRPRYILLADLPAGDVSTFWTAQLTVPGSAIPYQFFSLLDVTTAMSSLGYELRVRGVAERPLRVDALPPGHRVERTCNLLFGS
jgi:putative methyltransferase (TIGR04325 family)